MQLRWLVGLSHSQTKNVCAHTVSLAANTNSGRTGGAGVTGCLEGEAGGLLSAALCICLVTVAHLHHSSAQCERAQLNRRGIE